jgi:hypothetical protein
MSHHKKNVEHYNCSWQVSCTKARIYYVFHPLFIAGKGNPEILKMRANEMILLFL